MSLKLMHTSDVHLGAKFSFLGSRAHEQRTLLRSTFASLIDQALSAKVQLFVIAGDLFDTPFPAGVDVNHVQEQFGRLAAADIRIAVTPGNHDRLETGSVFAGTAFKSLEDSGHLKIFREKVEAWDVPELLTTVYGTATKERVSRRSPLDGLKVESSQKTRIGIFHGSLDITKDDGNAPISKDVLAKSGLDYVALGDWHSTLDVSAGNVTAWYSGSPEMLQPAQQGAGRVLQVEAGDGKASVRQLQSGKRKVYNHSLNLAEQVLPAAVLEAIKKHAEQQDFVVLTVEGTKKPGGVFDLDSLTRLLEEQFFYVKVKDDTKLELGEDVLKQFPETTIAGRFIRSLQARHTGDAQQDSIIDEAIQLGVSLLLKTDDSD
ncbi:MAG: putative metallophosphoesterase YhaO [candidate division WS6 bacterium OLB20]|uniref:Putative metallophosphoesterase YhaO n=1 Tax=candidate division WS6 bacterium OLB20 TaxID=1617426 RepID=A0A136LYM8_9BACT|nr:MAG: putative metallophosphoesterase YhaO [candidate division WS6 bacterium OLB20]